MGCQITIKQKSDLAQNVFMRAEIFTLEQENITLGGDGCTCILHDYEGAPARIQGIKHHYTFIPPENGGSFQLNGQTVSGPHPLHSGDSITTASDLIRFYLQYEKANIARSSRVLSQLTHVGVTVILIIQFLFMFFLISWLQDSPVWDRQQTRLNIIHRLDNLRRLYGNSKNFHTPLNEALGQEIFQDLTDQAHFVRRYSEDLLPRQRRTLLQDLKKYEEIYRWLSRPPQSSGDLDVDLNQAVLNILNTHTPK